jgi:GNAT superfamily N-acetyltransferase
MQYMGLTKELKSDLVSEENGLEMSDNVRPPNASRIVRADTLSPAQRKRWHELQRAFAQTQNPMYHETVERMRPGWTQFVALQGEDPIGFAAFELRKGETLHLEEMYIDPSHRQTGLARRFLRAATADMTRQGKSFQKMKWYRSTSGKNRVFKRTNRRPPHPGPRP